MLTSNKFLGLFVYNTEGQVVAYLLGEFETLPDSRLVFFIFYIYVSPKHRNKKIGSRLLYETKKIMKNEIGINFIMVFTNNNFNKIFNFYKKNGFIKDPMFLKIVMIMIILIVI